jgi:dipeptidyl-peptidase 4
VLGGWIRRDPRPDPTARRVAYVSDGALHAIDLGEGGDRRLVSDADPDVHWGLAEFIAAEEMERRRGYWWSPDGERILACRVDDRPVLTWHISSPVDPAAEPRATRYPQTGTPNAIVTMHVVGLDGSLVDVDWDREAFEYVVAVSWTEEGPPLALVQSRDQRTMQVLAIDPDSGKTESVWQDHDETWTDIIVGVPAWLTGGRLLTTGHRDDTRRILIDDEPVTPAGLHVEEVLDAGDSIVFRGTQEPTEMHVWRLDTASGTLEKLTADPGAHGAVVGGSLTVLVTETMDEGLPTATLTRGADVLHTFDRLAEQPGLEARVTFASVGPKDLRIALLTPGGREPGEKLPVLLDPYGGPHFGRVVRFQRMHLESQWFADQGFAVLVADGRGTPYRGVAWDQSVHHGYVDLALEDQVEALHAAAELFPFLDLGRVAIRGWSYGGYLTLAALLRRPDVFRAGISGAPVTDMRSYDTHYTERYLGTPQEQPDAYANADLIPDAPKLEGELLMIHGIADDNVYVAHSLRMSKALMEAGRRHSLIPLSGITHRPVDEAAAENMLKIEVEFLQRALG